MDPSNKNPENNPPLVDPIPPTSISEILGLLEVLDDRKGQERVYTLARDLNFDFSQLLLVIKAAEMLDFVHTPGTDVILKPVGKKMIELDMNSKKKVLLEQLRSLSIFEFVRGELMRREEGRMNRNDLSELLQQALPKEPVNQVFNTVIDWGRFAEFLGYSQDDGFIYLDQG